MRSRYDISSSMYDFLGPYAERLHRIRDYSINTLSTIKDQLCPGCRKVVNPEELLRNEEYSIDMNFKTGHCCSGSHSKCPECGYSIPIEYVSMADMFVKPFASHIASCDDAVLIWKKAFASIESCQPDKIPFYDALKAYSSYSFIQTHAPEQLPEREKGILMCEKLAHAMCYKVYLHEQVESKIDQGYDVTDDMSMEDVKIYCSIILPPTLDADMLDLQARLQVKLETYL